MQPLVLQAQYAGGGGAARGGGQVGHLQQVLRAVRACRDGTGGKVGVGGGVGWGGGASEGGRGPQAGSVSQPWPGKLGNQAVMAGKTQKGARQGTCWWHDREATAPFFASNQAAQQRRRAWRRRARWGGKGPGLRGSPGWHDDVAALACRMSSREYRPGSTPTWGGGQEKYWIEGVSGWQDGEAVCPRCRWLESFRTGPAARGEPAGCTQQHGTLVARCESWQRQ